MRCQPEIIRQVICAEYMFAQAHCHHECEQALIYVNDIDPNVWISENVLGCSLSASFFWILLIAY